MYNQTNKIELNHILTNSFLLNLIAKIRFIEWVSISENQIVSYRILKVPICKWAFLWSKTSPSIYVNGHDRLRFFITHSIKHTTYLLSLNPNFFNSIFSFFILLYGDRKHYEWPSYLRASLDTPHTRGKMIISTG